MQKNNQTDGGHNRSGPAGGKLPAGNPAGQPHANFAAKEAHIKEAGLGGNRTGEVSASVKRAQAEHDAANGVVPDTNAEAPTQTTSDVDQDDTPAIQVQVNTDHNIHGSERLSTDIADTVNTVLGRFQRQLTRVEIHLSDDNGRKAHGDDKRCLIEARPAGHQPLVVTHVAATVDDAVDGALDTMEKLLDSTFHKLHDSKGRTSLGEILAE